MFTPAPAPPQRGGMVISGAGTGGAADVAHGVLDGAPQGIPPAVPYCLVWARVTWSKGPALGPGMHWKGEGRPPPPPHTAIHGLHVPSHIGVDGNTHADRLADIGRRRSPPLRGQVTVSLAGGESLEESESETESDLEAPVMWTTMEGVGDHGTPLTAWQAASSEEREGRRGQPPLNTPPSRASDHTTTQTQLSPHRVCHTTNPWATRWSIGH